MKIAILGFGREGEAILRFLKKSPSAGRQGRDYKKAEIFICDKNPKIEAPRGITAVTGKDYLKNLNKFDIIFRSPGVPYNLPEIQRALKKGVEFKSATRLFFDNFKGKVIGVTGTKGKGTTAALLYKILKASGKKVYIAGNMGIPPIEILRKADKNTIAVIELSSFQLQDLKKSPQIGVILDIFPDHLDAHKNTKEYLDAKSNIARWQKKNDKIFYFSDNKKAEQIASKSRAKKIPVPISSAHSYEWFQSLRKEIKIPGEHNFKNAVMAATVALSLGCKKSKILEVIKGFRGNEHRLELVRIITVQQAHHKNKSQICFYNDSASTNPQTAAAAICAFSEPKILIAGGKDKGLNYSPLARALKNSNTKLVILFGENKNKIKKALSRIKNNELKIMMVKDLKSATNLAYKTAKKLVNLSTYKLITIVFSPASASFDMFKDYAERGKKFKEFVGKLK